MLTELDRPYRGRRISWREFRCLTKREAPKAENDDDAAAECGVGK